MSVDIPWHVTAFHADYKMLDPQNTTAAMLQRAASIAQAAGLRYVYAGNLPGQVGDLEDTHCPRCHETLVSRRGYIVREMKVTASGACPACGEMIPGRWAYGRPEGLSLLPEVVPDLRLRHTIELVLDLLNRPLRNLRLSVTDRCNLRCQYCMPEADYVWLPKDDLLHFEEISILADVFISLGVDRMRLTGGEPLLRRNLSSLVAMLSAKPGLADLALTSNGVLLSEQVDELKASRPAPPDRQPRHPATDRFTALARFDELTRVKEGIVAARAAPSVS